MSHFEYSIDSPKEQLLVRWLKPGIPHLRHQAQIPQNLISDETLDRVCQAVSDDLLIKTAEDLDLSSSLSLYEAARFVPDLNAALATTEAQNIMRQRIAEQQPPLILQALAKVVAELTVHIAGGTLQAPWRIAKILLVLASASFSPCGDELLSEFAVVLNSHEVHIMIRKFGAIAMKGEHEIIDKMDRIILSNSRWADWALWFIDRAQPLAPQCWGALVVSRHPGDSSPWNAIWDTLLTQKEETSGS